MDWQLLAFFLTAIFFSFSIIGCGALSGLFSERSGVVNIAIEGFMIFGGLTYMIMVKVMPADANMGYQIAGFLIAMIVTGLLSLLHAYASITLKANQIISGTAINLLAAGVAVFVVNVVYKGSISGVASSFPAFAINPEQGRVGYAFSISLLITLCLFGLTFVLMNYSRYGLRLKAAGENPHALEAQGISVILTRYQAVMISGMLAGLAGAFFAQWRGAFFGTTEGLGYVALAILIFGRWRTHWVMLGALFFSILVGLANVSISSSSLPVGFADNSNLIQAIPFILALITLIVFSKQSLAPLASGQAYDRSRR